MFLHAGTIPAESCQASAIQIPLEQMQCRIGSDGRIKFERVLLIDTQRPVCPI